MENTTTSRSSICWKIRQALSTNPAFRAIHRIKHYYQEPRPVTTHANSSSLPPFTHLPQNMKTNNTQGEGVIPIEFDSSIPTSPPMVHGQVSKVASPHVGISQVAAKVEPEPWHVQGSRVGAFKGEHNGKATTGPWKDSEQQDKKTLDINDTFTEYIQRAKYRIKTVSNVGRGQNYSAPDEASGSINKMENQKDHAKKIKTTSNVGIGRTSSLKRGHKS
ncbi:hypothetical protein CR513_61105, partial [Mucuna pruriens]